MIVAVVLYGCEILSVTLFGKTKFRVFEDPVLITIYAVITYGYGGKRRQRHYDEPV